MAIREMCNLRTQMQVRGPISDMRARECNASAVDQLDACIRAARSLKAMARMCSLPESVKVAEAIETSFAASRRFEIHAGANR